MVNFYSASITLKYYSNIEIIIITLINKILLSSELVEWQTNKEKPHHLHQFFWYMQLLKYITSMLDLQNKHFQNKIV